MANEAAVALRLLGFWEAHAMVWFAQANTQFALRGITADETRYNHVVSALSASTAACVLSCLQDPPLTGKYETLKNLLLGAFGLSEEERAQQLLDLPDLGEACPSE